MPKEASSDVEVLLLELTGIIEVTTQPTLPGMITHDHLVDRAVRWLKGSAVYPVMDKMIDIQEQDGGLKYVEEPEQQRLYKAKCSVVFAEIVTSTSETPDAIGFFRCGDRSILIECKASISDYYSDRSKSFRKFPEQGVGDYRWYLTPKGMITDKMELPAGWGLLELCGKVIRVKRIPARLEKNVGAEVNMLWSAVRRLQIGNDNYSKPIR